MRAELSLQDEEGTEYTSDFVPFLWDFKRQEFFVPRLFLQRGYVRFGKKGGLRQNFFHTQLRHDLHWAWLRGANPKRVAHHIDLGVTSNRLDNITLVTKAEHFRLHNFPRRKHPSRNTDPEAPPVADQVDV